MSSSMHYIRPSLISELELKFPAYLRSRIENGERCQYISLAAVNHFSKLWNPRWVKTRETDWREMYSLSMERIFTQRSGRATLSFVISTFPLKTTFSNIFPKWIGYWLSEISEDSTPKPQNLNSPNPCSEPKERASSPVPLYNVFDFFGIGEYLVKWLSTYFYLFWTQFEAWKYFND